MGWTEERVELLKKRWNEGLSASQIAKELGGVTRNAVIGKVHRVGLFRNPGTQNRTRFQKALRPKLPKPGVSAATVVIPFREPPMRSAPVEPDTRPVRYVEETPGLATVLTVGEHMCHWPIGDPQRKDFTFCGRCTGAGPYCHEHAQVAYLPETSKKYSTANDLYRSIRRHL